MSNKARADRRSASYARGEARKALRRKANEDAAAENKRRRLAGEPTPWEIARAARSERRRKALGDKGNDRTDVSL